MKRTMKEVWQGLSPTPKNQISPRKKFHSGLPLHHINERREKLEARGNRFYFTIAIYACLVYYNPYSFDLLPFSSSSIFFFSSVMPYKPSEAFLVWESPVFFDLSCVYFLSHFKFHTCIVGVHIAIGLTVTKVCT